MTARCDAVFMLGHIRCLIIVLNDPVQHCDYIIGEGRKRELAAFVFICLRLVYCLSVMARW